MKKSLLVPVLASVIGSALAFAAPVLAAGPTWELSSVFAGGTACATNVDTTFVMAAGGDLSVVFQNLTIDLPRSGAGSDMKTCTIEVPGVPPARSYPSSITQTYTYDVNKSAGGSGSLTNSGASIFGKSFTGFGLSFPAGGAENQSQAHQGHTDQFPPTSDLARGFCSGAPTGGLVANFTLTASKASAGDNVTLFGQSLTYEFSSVWHPCP
jgi:hypothetical protein